MFDVSNPKDVQEIEKKVERNYEYSPAWDNHKAVTMSVDENIIDSWFYVVESNQVTSLRLSDFQQVNVLNF